MFERWRVLPINGRNRFFIEKYGRKERFFGKEVKKGASLPIDFSGNVFPVQLLRRLSLLPANRYSMSGMRNDTRLLGGASVKLFRRFSTAPALAVSCSAAYTDPLERGKNLSGQKEKYLLLCWMDRSLFSGLFLPDADAFSQYRTDSLKSQRPAFSIDSFVYQSILLTERRVVPMTVSINTLTPDVFYSLPTDWAVSLELISTIEAVPFYERHGFEQRPCAWDDPGMFKILR